MAGVAFTPICPSRRPVTAMWAYNLREMDDKGLKIQLEYCAQCGYLPRAQWMAGEVLAALQDDIAVFSLIPGGGSCFEWYIDGELVYSKSASGFFPDVDQIIASIAERL